MIAPKVEEFSKKYTNVVFLKVDVDNLSDVAAKCDIRSMPTFQIYKGGEKVGEVIGAAAKPLEDKIKEFA
jgi:thioredoxin 1